MIQTRTTQLIYVVLVPRVPVLPYTYVCTYNCVSPLFFHRTKSRFTNLGHRLGDNVWPYLRSVQAYGGGWAPGRRTEVVLINSCKPGSTKVECEHYQGMAWKPLSSKPIQYLSQMNNHCFSKLIVGVRRRRERQE